MMPAECCREGTGKGMFPKWSYKAGLCSPRFNAKNKGKLPENSTAVGFLFSGEGASRAFSWLDWGCPLHIREI
jgi:hypothetical protein